MSPIITSFVLYSILILVITFFAYRQTRSHADYILGSRRFNAMITAMGVGASDMSGWLMQGLPALVYTFGVQQFWLPLSLLIGSYLNWLWVAPRLRIYTELASNSLTLPAFFENRFCVRRGALRYVTAILFLVFFTVYAGSGFVAGAKLFVTAFDYTYIQALWLSGPIIIIYCVFGGYLAINWIDLFQGTLMLVALLLIPVYAMGDFSGPIHLMDAIAQIDPTKLDLFSATLDITFFSAIAWGLGYFGQPHILVRFMSAQNELAIRYGRRICITWMALALLGAVLIGLAGVAYFPAGSLPSSEAVMPELTQILFNPWITGFIFAAVISAIMSTVAAVMMAAASALVNDFYRHRFRPEASQKELIWVGRASAFLIAIMAFSMAFFPDNPSIFSLVAHAWGGLGAAFGPVVLASLFYRNMTANAALAGMLCGGGTAILWILLGKLNVLPIFQLYELLPGFIAGFIGIYWGKKGSHPNQKSLELFDKMRASL